MELASVYINDNNETCSKYNEMGLDRDEDIDANKDRKISQIEARAQNRGLSVGSKCAVLSTVCLGLTCILVAVIVVLHIKLKAEREEQATHMLQSSSRDQTEKDQLRNSFKSLSQKNLELETRVNDLTAEKSQFQSNLNSLSQKKLELETRVIDLTTKKGQLETRVKDLTAEKKQFETRVNDLTAEKSQFQSNFNSLSQKKLELETRVNDLTTKKGQLETRVKDLTAERSQLQSNFSSLSQKNLELESRIRSLSEEESKQSCLFMSTELKSWSDSRQYCRDRGADLVIINTEEKQRFISSIVGESVWIGLSDREQEGNMKWVDNSPLKQG
uniref:C-type lectin domain-containing protein n=1 Tax=Cyprinus carpio TaxID=7962 RepID=A0A8C2GJS7_CYPCA